MLKPYTLRLPTITRVFWLEAYQQMRSTLYCVVSFIAACVDASRTVCWDRSYGISQPILSINDNDLFINITFTAIFSVLVLITGIRISYTHRPITLIMHIYRNTGK